RPRRHDSPEELALHQLEALDGNPVLGRRVIDEQPRQVEQPGEPGHHENDVQRLHPKHWLTILRRTFNLRWKKWSAPGTSTTGSPGGGAQSSTGAGGIVSSLSPWRTSAPAGPGGTSKLVTATPTSAIGPALTRTASFACIAAPKEKPARTAGLI